MAQLRLKEKSVGLDYYVKLCVAYDDIVMIVFIYAIYTCIYCMYLIYLYICVQLFHGNLGVNLGNFYIYLASYCVSSL